MAEPLKQSTAVTVKVGPFLDTNGAPVASLTISQADIRLSKNGGDFAPSNNAAGATHDENGVYDVPLDATDTDTAGRLTLVINESGALPCRRDYSVLPANIFDSGFASDKLEVDVVQVAGAAVSASAAQLGVNVVQVSGDAAAADNLEAEYDGTGFKSYLRRSTAQSATSRTIALDAGASAVDGYYDGTIVAIMTGTGSGQARVISSYVGATKTATVAEAWTIPPASDSVFVVLPMGREKLGLWVGAR
jgi:hypothetical protein